MKTLIFRGEGNPSIGLGHLYRLFALAQSSESLPSFLVMHHNSCAEIVPSFLNIKIVPDSIGIENEPEWLATNFNPEESILIADGYQFDVEYQKAIKRLGFKMIYIDDLASPTVADVVINHAPHIDEHDFELSTGTQFCLGTQFALLRSSFLNVAKESRKIAKIRSAFVSFGGADPLDLTLSAVQAIESFHEIEQIHVVLGAAYPHQSIFELAGSNKRLQLHQNLDEFGLLKVMQGCNLGIVPASTVLFELCCVNMPILAGYFVENQKRIYEGFVKHGAIFPGGCFKEYTVKRFTQKLAELLTLKTHEPQLEAQRRLFDGEIANRQLEIVHSLC